MLTATQEMRNSDAEPTEDDAEEGRASTSEQVSISFSALFDTLCSSIQHSDASVLLLYNLLNKCTDFQDCVLVRSDVDSLLLPLLHKLYDASSRQPHQLYMLQVRAMCSASFFKIK